MIRRFLSFVLLLSGFIVGLVPDAGALERRIALVIGNAKYPNAPLTNPHNDARDMAAVLRKGGFEVIELIDGTQKEMNRAISRFGDKLTSDSVALFYYAGHGMQVRGKNYLIPVDAQITNETSIRVESVDVDGVLDQLASSELNVVILDACRNNPFERRFRAMGGGLAQMDAPKGSLIAYATAPGKTAADGDGRNGLFTQELLKQIQVPGLTIEQVFKNVRREVARATRDNQIPWESSSMTGDFYFMPVQRPPVAVMSPPQARPSDPPAVSPSVAKPLVLTDTGATPTPTSLPSAKEVPANKGGPAFSTASSVTATEKASQPVAESTGQTISAGGLKVSGGLVIDPVTGAMTGEGKIEWANGDRYEGTMRGGKKQGRGVFSWPDGQRYDGEWDNDVIHGRGTLFYANGDRYEGEFLNAAPHGNGVYTLRNGDVYRGSWVNGNKHGHGRLTWKNGDFWEGEFKDDVQTSNGKLVYGDGHDTAATRSAVMERNESPKPADAKALPAKKGK